MLPKEQQRHYKSFLDAVKRIPAEEGTTSLWKGGVPTVFRAMAYNFAMFTSFEEAKERLGAAMPNNPTMAWLMATVIGGTSAALCSLPFDNAKTKL